MSIHERTRELGLLRAVGLTRGQLRTSVRVEALIMSLFGSVEGLLLGVVLGAALVTAQHAQGLTRLSVPLPQLLIIGAVAGAAGVLAAWRPAEEPPDSTSCQSSPPNESGHRPAMTLDSRGTRPPGPMMMKREV